PTARPNGSQLLVRLGRRSTSIRPSLVPAPGGQASTPTALVGRDAHMQALRTAFDDTRMGRPVAALVHGRSGMGKSTLVQHFLDRLEERSLATVLHGRAYERESVPYRAVDSVIDALSRHLVRMRKG